MRPQKETIAPPTSAGRARAAGEGGPLKTEQALLYARDIARMNALRRAYERLLPVALDPTAPLLPGATVRQATLLFTDVRGFTALAQRLDKEPERLLAVLNEHFAVVVRAVGHCGGAVEKFLGDGIFATFGARQDETDHPARALAAAIAVVGANEALNRRRSQHWGFRLEVGVAIWTGKVVVGMLGAPDRYEFGVLGDAVNVAARLVGRCRPSEVLIGDSTYRAVAGRVSAALLGKRAVRGRMGRLRLYRLQLSRP